MKTLILRVVAHSDVLYIPSKKQEGSQLAKCLIRLKELGGQYEDEYLCALFGNLATCQFTEGDLVVASLRFQVHEVNGNCYQEIVANDVVPISRK